MKTHCFIDTNIWLYSIILTDNKKTETAKSIINDDQIEIIISTQVLNEFCSNLIKKTSFTEQDIKKIIQSFYNNYMVYRLDKRTLIKASELRIKLIVFLFGTV